MSETSTAPSCIHCQTALVGPYCHACGQDNTRRDRPLGDLRRSALSESFNLDGSVAASVRDMVIAPGRLLAAYRDGRTQGFVSPIKLFLVVSAAFFVMLVWTDLAIYQFLPEPRGSEPAGAQLVPNGVLLTGLSLEDVYLAPEGEARRTADIMRAIAALKPQADAVQTQAINDFSAYIGTFSAVNAALDVWLPRLLWLLIPAYALLLWPLYRGRRFAEHVLFALWAHTLIFLLLMGLALVNRTGFRPSFWLLAIPYLAYFTLAARTYYAERWQRSLVKGFVHIMAFFWLVWGPIALAVAMTSAADQLPPSFWGDTDMGDAAFDRWIIAPPEVP